MNIFVLNSLFTAYPNLSWTIKKKANISIAKNTICLIWRKSPRVLFKKTQLFNNKKKHIFNEKNNPTCLIVRKKYVVCLIRKKLTYNIQYNTTLLRH